MAGYFPPIFPAGCKEDKQHCKTLRIPLDPAHPLQMPIICCSACLLSSHGSRGWRLWLWVFILSREPRHRPALPSIRHPYVSASQTRVAEVVGPRGEISFHAGCLSPQTPTPTTPSRQLGFHTSAGLHASTLISVHACMLNLDWSPCGCPSIKPSNPALQCLAASDSSPCKYGTACDLEQRLRWPLAVGIVVAWWRVVWGYTNNAIAPRWC
ncbi:hypothetical protein KVR01_011697 [Diaporthe batatas]|uniref:uncharacterized protein n=1 Tax=Diaporthe batatas TaxID=748121 RepID=UPI001D04C83F|nr:uncharacterized protein KVR01_011697 [Diaporthe batatas]KAG8158575.1 hypothetical protein KVR01_011697 [Diaporthe batatas]